MPRKLTPLQEQFAQECVRGELETAGKIGWRREALRRAQAATGHAPTADDKTASERASKLLRHPGVAARIDALHGRVASVALDAQMDSMAKGQPLPAEVKVPEMRAAVPVPAEIPEPVKLYAFDTSVRATLTELACIGMADPRGLFDEAGNLLDLKDMPEHLARAVSSIKVHRQRGQDGSQTRAETVEIKFWPKVEALRLIGQHRRMFVELHENGAANEFAHMTDEQIDAELARYEALDAIEKAQRQKAKATEGGDR